MIENEIVIYCQLPTKHELKDAYTEEVITQYERRTLSNKNKKQYVDTRVRKTILNDSTNYTLTVKNRLMNSAVDSSLEITNPITEDMYMAFATAADRLIEKTRYTMVHHDVKFKIETVKDNKYVLVRTVKVEIDTFMETDWVKIDIELDELMRHVPTDENYKIVVPRELLPLNSKNYIFSTTDNRYEKNKLYELYRTVFAKDLKQ
jgi:CYTH domain-containing protein